MTFIPRRATDEEIIAIAHHWIDLLADENYETVFAELGHAMAYQYDCSGPESIRRSIETYRSPELYSGINKFRVTNWRTAAGGNPAPIKHIVRYKPNDTGLAGALSFHLPLNGSWSDLEVNLVWFDSKNPDEGYPLSLEDIVSPKQMHRDFENAP